MKSQWLAKYLWTGVNELLLINEQLSRIYGAPGSCFEYLSMKTLSIDLGLLAMGIRDNSWFSIKKLKFRDNYTQNVSNEISKSIVLDDRTQKFTKDFQNKENFPFLRYLIVSINLYYKEIRMFWIRDSRRFLLSSQIIVVTYDTNNKGCINQ